MRTPPLNDQRCRGRAIPILGVSQILSWGAIYYTPVLIAPLIAQERGWSLTFFYLAPLPMLASENAAAGKFIDGWHQAMEWTLLVFIGVHVAAAMAHLIIYRDRIMQRMLPG